MIEMQNQQNILKGTKDVCKGLWLLFEFELICVLLQSWSRMSFKGTSILKLASLKKKNKKKQIDQSNKKKHFVILTFLRSVNFSRFLSKYVFRTYSYSFSHPACIMSCPWGFECNFFSSIPSRKIRLSCSNSLFVAQLTRFCSFLKIWNHFFSMMMMHY